MFRLTLITAAVAAFAQPAFAQIERHVREQQTAKVAHVTPALGGRIDIARRRDARFEVKCIFHSCRSSRRHVAMLVIALLPLPLVFCADHHAHRCAPD